MRQHACVKILCFYAPYTLLLLHYLYDGKRKFRVYGKYMGKYMESDEFVYILS